MKKTMKVLIALGLIGMLAGCGSNSGTSSQQAESSQPETTEQSAETQTEESVEAASQESGENGETSGEGETTASSEAESDGKVLVVYYSATGHTENAANIIAQATGGDLFELEPADPYTDEDLDWTDDNSRVTVEHDNPDQRDVELVADTVDNWDSYDTVFIGYPIWWGIAAWPVDTFVEANDFTGKTVIPFCTSSSSELGESGELLAEMAGTGDWLEGMRFRSSVDEADVQEWIDSLGV